MPDSPDTDDLDPDDLEPSEGDLSGSYVTYDGPADTRHIPQSEWSASGVSDQGDTTWGADNGRSIPVEDFTPEALDLLKASPGFQVG